MLSAKTRPWLIQINICVTVDKIKGLVSHLIKFLHNLRLHCGKTLMRRVVILLGHSCGTHDIASISKDTE